VLLPLPDGEERLEDRFTAADRAFAGRREPVALGKDEPAGAAFGRGHLQIAAASVEAVTNMFQMVIDVLFRNVRLYGYLPGGQRLVEKQPSNSATQRLPGRARNSRFAWALSHYSLATIRRGF